MDLGAHMVGDEANDPLAVGSGHLATRIGDSGSQPVDPQPTVRVKHDLDD